MAKKKKLLTTKDLGREEKLLTLRRREGHTQVQEAARYGLTLAQYRDMELGNAAVPGRIGLAIGKLLDHEACYLMRRRSGLSVGEVAEEVGCCRYWFHLMETGVKDPARLIDYWS